MAPASENARAMTKARVTVRVWLNRVTTRSVEGGMGLPYVSKQGFEAQYRGMPLGSDRKIHRASAKQSHFSVTSERLVHRECAICNSGGERTLIQPARIRSWAKDP